MKIFRLIILLCLASCATTDGSSQTQEYLEAVRYENEFRQDFPDQPKIGGIIFAPPRQMGLVDDPILKAFRPAHGQVLTNDDHLDYPVFETRIIQLNIVAWRELNQWERRELIYHELGHALLGLGHPPTDNPPSIMYSYGGWRVKSDGSNWLQLVTSLQEKYKELNQLRILLK